jgi:hypothetical protein
MKATYYIHGTNQNPRPISGFAALKTALKTLRRIGRGETHTHGPIHDQKAWICRSGAGPYSEGNALRYAWYYSCNGDSGGYYGK